MKKMFIALALAVTFFTYTTTAFAIIGPNGYRTAPSGSTGQVSCGTSAAVVLPIVSGERSWIISNHSGTTVYIGPFGVTTANGLILPSGYSMSDGGIHPFVGALYCITASGTATVSRFVANW